MFVKNSLIFLAVAALFLGCENSDSSSNRQLSGEYILRSHNEFTLKDLPPQRVDIAPYPWEEGHQGTHPKITKEFFVAFFNMAEVSVISTMKVERPSDN